MDLEIKPDLLVPFRWPSGWTDPKMIGLVEGGPINCLLFEESLPSAVAEAAHKAGVVTREWRTLAATALEKANWDSGNPVVALTGQVWPSLTPPARRTGPDGAASGPTAAPWIDSTSWVARLAECRDPGKQIWLDFAPPDRQAPSENAYRLAIADAAATGARWMVALDPALSRGLAAGNEGALKTWGGITSTLSFFEKRSAWRSYRKEGPLGVVSTFSGANALMGTEFLNLAGRRNLLYRVFDSLYGAPADWSGLRAVIYLDEEKPAAPLAAKLAAFGKGGGLLIVSRGASPAFTGEAHVESAVAGYDVRRYGRGLLAAPQTAWDDAYWVVADTQDLVSRRYDPVRLFNGSSVWIHCSAPARGLACLIQLVRFASRQSSLSLRINRPHRAVRMHTLAAAGAVPLEPVRVDHQLEYHLPEFSVYAALEVTA